MANIWKFVDGTLYAGLRDDQVGKSWIEIDNLAIVRLEQLYPFPDQQLTKITAKYGDCKYIWAQEEPENMGPWSFIMRHWKYGHIDCCSRHSSASPASGSPKVHEIRHNEIIDKVMNYALKK